MCTYVLASQLWNQLHIYTNNVIHVLVLSVVPIPLFPCQIRFGLLKANCGGINILICFDMTGFNVICQEYIFFFCQFFFSFSFGIALVLKNFFLPELTALISINANGLQRTQFNSKLLVLVIFSHLIRALLTNLIKYKIEYFFLLNKKVNSKQYNKIITHCLLQIWEGRKSRSRHKIYFALYTYTYT